MEILQHIWMALSSENKLIVDLQGIPLTFIEAYLIMLLFTTIFKINSDKKHKCIYILLFSIIGCFNRFLIPNPYSTFINIVLCPTLIVICFKTTIFKAIMCEFLPLFINTIIDFVLGKLFFLLFKVDTNDVIAIPIYRIAFSFIEYLLLYFIYLVLKNKKISINLLHFGTKKETIFFTVNSILGIIAIFCQMYLAIYYIDFLPTKIIIISISSLLAYFLISLVSLINTNKLNIAKQNLEETQLMNKTLTILNDKIRAFRHDFNNIIQALGGYIGAKDLDGLEKYYKQLLKDCTEVNNLTGLNPESINNPAIYSLIGSKYYLATEQNIDFNINIFMDLNSIDMKIYEFCRILGILLDNAIQATQECEIKKVNITIRKDNKNNRQLLIVENTYKNKEIDTEKIYEKGYSTKEGNTGLGLWEVRQILKKNTNLNLFTSKDDEYFKQQLEIYRA